MLKTLYVEMTGQKIVMSPLELMQRLAALVPRSKLNLICFHGVLAPVFSNLFDPTLTHLSLLNDWADLFPLGIFRVNSKK